MYTNKLVFFFQTRSMCNTCCGNCKDQYLISSHKIISLFFLDMSQHLSCLSDILSKAVKSQQKTYNDYEFPFRIIICGVQETNCTSRNVKKHKFDFGQQMSLSTTYPVQSIFTFGASLFTGWGWQLKMPPPDTLIMKPP